MKQIEYYNLMDDYKRNYEYYNRNFEYVFEEFRQFWLNKHRVFKFADVIIESDKLPLERLVPQENLRRFFGVLSEISMKMGTYFSYELFFKALFGDIIVLDFEKLWGKITKLKVGNYNYFFYNFKVNQEETFVKTDDNYDLCFNELMIVIDIDRVIAFLQFVKPFQDIIEFEFL